MSDQEMKNEARRIVDRFGVWSMDQRYREVLDLLRRAADEARLEAQNAKSSSSDEESSSS